MRNRRSGKVAVTEEASAPHDPSDAVTALPGRTQRLLVYRAYDPARYPSGRSSSQHFDAFTGDA